MASKNIAVFCDGTWQHLDQRNPTNVNRLARCVRPFDDTGTPQVVRYDDGVGVATGIMNQATALIGGAFGEGLENKVMRAYEFLCLNYDVGDKIFIFGFSRGAYTARCLAGLLHLMWILRRDQADKISIAQEMYHNPIRREAIPAAAALAETIAQFRKDHCHPGGTIQYIGVWDTVGELGIPKTLLFSHEINAKFRFFDTDLSDAVGAARHAVAIDETRDTYSPSLWTNIDTLNAAGHATELPYGRRPYQQQWFPGHHSGVGGGQDDHGLSLSAMGWIAEGALNAGLRFDEAALAAYRAQEKPEADFVIEKPSLGEYFTKTVGGESPRSGPTCLDEVSEAARLRWARVPAWRDNPTLTKVKDDIAAEEASRS